MGRCPASRSNSAGSKQVRLHFAGESAPADLGRFGDVHHAGPVAELKVERPAVAECSRRHSRSAIRSST